MGAMEDQVTQAHCTHKMECENYNNMKQLSRANIISHCMHVLTIKAEIPDRGLRDNLQYLAIR